VPGDEPRPSGGCGSEVSATSTLHSRKSARSCPGIQCQIVVLRVVGSRRSVTLTTISKAAGVGLVKKHLVRVRSLQFKGAARVEFSRLSTNPPRVATQAATAMIMNARDKGNRKGTFSISDRR